METLNLNETDIYSTGKNTFAGKKSFFVSQSSNFTEMMKFQSWLIFDQKSLNLPLGKKSIFGLNTNIPFGRKKIFF